MKNPLYFDPMRLDRPHRSGVLAIFFTYAVLWLYGYAVMPHDWSHDGSFSLHCYLAPWDCPAAVKHPPPEPKKVYHVTYAPNGHVRVKKKLCCCGWQFSDTENFKTVLMTSTTWQCDYANDLVVSTPWESLPLEIKPENRPVSIDGMYYQQIAYSRIHCEDKVK